ncbi:unnamed protein product [Moneuplotes crassus]|uniref:BZIP domain-containing protein n=2 Tax=Euplotes crassus TaxID=5936 RepID=A0AAD2CY44_EUPCR|nr:unnamed protein product [Moneuplotes crassus]
MSLVGTKRAKTSSDEEYELESRQNATSSRERARKHRQRKKEYYQRLEKRNLELQEQVDQLRCEIAKLKQDREDQEQEEFGRTSEHVQVQQNLKNFEEVKLPEISKLLNLINGTTNSENSLINENKPENGLCTRKEDSNEYLPGINVEKIPILRKHFQEILDNILTVEGQIAIVVFDNVSISKFIKIANSERKKFMKRKEEDPVMKQILETKISKRLINFVREHGKDYMKILQDIRKAVRKLVYVRNKIFFLKNKIKELESKANFSNNFPLSLEDQTKILKAMSDLKKKGVLDYMSLWHIPKRDPHKEFGSDIEISDPENA